MSTAYILAKRVINMKKKSKAYCTNMVNVYYAAGQLTDDEYTELIALIEDVYGE